jgi:CheY-like chemotaxis protein
MKNNQSPNSVSVQYINQYTRRKKMVAELKQAKQRAQQATDCMNRFLAIMAHEMRGPIANMISAVDLLKPEKNPTPERMQEVITILDQQGWQALEVLKNLVRYGQLDTTYFEGERTTGALHLTHFLSRFAKKYLNALHPNIEFSWQVKENNIQSIAFDWLHASEVLTIVLDNALKFTHQGTVTLFAELMPSHRLKFTIKDTGCGIAKHYLQNIFNTFLDSTPLEPEKTYAKMGLKLPLAKRITELSGGSFTIESQENMGTTVCITFPYNGITFDSKPSATLHDEEPFQEDAPKQAVFPFTILLVEDNTTHAALAQSALTRLGCQVVWVDTALKAVETLTQKIFDLIFMDITLPGITGVALTSMLQAVIPETTQIVAVTAHASARDHEYFLKNGMMTMLAKPVTEDNFKAFFQDYLRMLDGDED